MPANIMTAPCPAALCCCRICFASGASLIIMPQPRAELALKKETVSSTWPTRSQSVGRKTVGWAACASNMRSMLLSG
jgi:hypothetical protein